jgi:hypothetical protein
MLTLYSYAGLFGVPDNNGNGLKMFAFLKLAGVPVRHEHLFDAQEVWIDSRQLEGVDPLESEIKAAIELAEGWRYG